MTFPNGTDQPVLVVDVPTVTAATEYTLTLTVTDHSGAKDSDTVKLSVINGPPLTTLAVSTFPQVVREGQLATIAITVEGGTAPYDTKWVQRPGSGPQVTLLTPPDPQAEQLLTRFNVPAVDQNQEIIFDVTVTDAAGAMGTTVQRVILMDTLPGAVPVQALRLQPIPTISVVAGSTAVLDAVANGGDGTYTWKWEQKSGTTATLSANNVVAPTLTVAASAPAESLTFDVTVTDGHATTRTDTVSVTVLPAATTLPLALSSLPDVVVDEGTHDVTLAGSVRGGSGNYTYSWTITGGTPALVVKGGTSQQRLVFDVPALKADTRYDVKFTVSDGAASVSDTFVVRAADLASTLNLAHLNTQTVSPGHQVFLQGSEASGGKQPYTYAWSQSGMPAVTLMNGNTPNPSFTVPTSIIDSTVLHFTVAVTDAVGNRFSASEDVNVEADLSVTLTGPDTTLVDSDVNLHAVAHGGTPPYSFTYQPLDTVLRTSIAHMTGENPSFPVRGVAVGVVLPMTVTVTDSTGKHATSARYEVTVAAPAGTRHWTDGLGWALPAKSLLCKGSGTTLDYTGTVQCSDLDLVLGIPDQVVECPADQPYAFTKLTIPADGAAAQAFRGCASEATCRHLWYDLTSAEPLCLPFDHNSSDKVTCYYCSGGVLEGAVDPDDPSNADDNIPDKNLWRP